ncbi:MAG: hypothetical protein F6K54_08480 [Okeania sp. SIO3B5]|uniref:hypothetical protein n=1 Tax=Okeania sp. SIO3B5 TaxID=2607811 RepID=UPI00140173EA|nr:hypothetical protein [Okeania sp. SIO3B5]NEO53113.1 hypothetical protein [Okeania sp. SIO3B5]
MELTFVVRFFVSQLRKLLSLISCPVEYLHFGEGKAEGRRQEAEGKKRLEGKRFFYH